MGLRPSRIERRAHGIAVGLIALAPVAAPAQVAGDQAPSCPPGLSCTASGDEVGRVKAYVDGVVGSALNGEPVRNGQRPVLGAIVGVSWHGKRTYVGYGRDAPAYGPDTIVEIGSITKVFTTALLAEAVQDGAVDLDGKLSAYGRAAGLDHVTRCGGQATLRQLADFSSGMPRLPGNVPADHGIGRYTERDFKDWASDWTPKGAFDGSCPLPESYSYSNASVGLLGYIVSDRLETSYRNLIADRITAPLGMSSTFLPGEDGSVPAHLAPRIATGRSNTYRPVRPWPYFAWFAAGALRSDAEDMLSFGEAALGNVRAEGSAHRGGAASLEAALRMAQTTTYPVRKPDGSLAFDQALSWVRRPGDPSRGLAPLHFKDGGTDGFSTILIVDHAEDLAIFVAVGEAGVGIDALGIRLARIMR